MKNSLLFLVAALIVITSCVPVLADSTTDEILRRLEAKIDALAKDNATLRAKLNQAEGMRAAPILPASRTATDVSPSSQPLKNVYAASHLPEKAPVYKAPLIPAFYNWTGFYVGLNGGYAWGRDSTHFSGNSAVATQFAAGAFPSILAPDPKGFFGGGQFGYNYQMNQWVFGLETDLAYANIQSSQVVTVPAFGGVFTTSAESKLDAFGTFRVRLGVTPVERYLFYVTGGFAYGHAKSNVSEITQVNGAPAPCISIFDFCSSGSTSKWLGGWTAGGGLEFALANNWSVKTEYLYYDLGSATSSFTASNFFLPGIAFNASSEFRGHMFRAGLNYKFGGIGLLQ